MRAAGVAVAVLHQDAGIIKSAIGAYKQKKRLI